MDRRRAIGRVALLTSAAIGYLIAASQVAPGFYDGFGPPQPYSFTCPPPQAGANQKPASGHADIKVINGVSDAEAVYTADVAPQLVMGFLPGAFDAAGKTTITVDITPVPTCIQPTGIRFVTNAYRVVASANLMKSSGLVLRYSNLLPDPQDVYFATDPNGPWKPLGRTQQAQPWTIDAMTTSFGYFAAGYSSVSPSPASVRIGGGQLLPVIVAALIVLVVLASLPLAILRHRRSPGNEDI